MIADDLRRQADHFIEITELKTSIGRDPSEKPSYNEPEEDYEDEDVY